MQPNHDDTSRALLEAAHRLLAEHGSEALTVRRIATEAGMSTMNVYSRFGGKDGVIDELYIDGFTRLYAAIDSVPVTDDFAADLVDMAHTYRRFALDNPTYYKVMFRSAIQEFTPSPRATDLARSGLTVIADRVRVGQEHGQVRSDQGHDPLSVGAWLWASCHGLVTLEILSVATEQVDWAAVFDSGIRTSVVGLHPSSISHD
jgi:AcrR family transcriptional regulator